ncbi:hypothetical protein KQI86_15045 [Clostridium sp. MSJ-11]|uniref:Uncharacterized protein n=1 Tax=Clostridium mobile TaxID=2841512 RepID=A0ABS6EMM4_9CLOT|nr:hypothetical protein [Clostridium mobile]MBU5485634.1 hypothetical protein [Clostridium mobile]
MKSTKRIITWIIFSLVIQIIGFIYIEKVYLSTNTSVKFKKVEKKEKDSKKDIEVPIPEGAEHVSLSFDGKYVTYYIDGQLKVINTKDGQEKKVSFEEGIDISFYKWLPDRNRMLIAEKHNSSKSSGLKLSYYDVDRDEKNKIKDLTWSDENSEVEDIQYSIFTNVIYVKVSRSGGRSSFYWIDINKQLKNLYLKSDFVGEIAILHNEDRLVYEDTTYDKIYATGRENSIKIKGVDSPRLLGVDDDDNVYIGALENEKISKIYYGSLETPTSEWNVMPLVDPASREDIFILGGGKIVINDNLKGAIKEISTGKEYSYSGRFLQVYSGGVASIKDGKLIKTAFK